MHKIEIFLPLPGMTEAMNAYFSEQKVIRPGGLPTGPELYSNGLSEEELLQIGHQAAQDEADKLCRFTATDLIVEEDAPFIGEFLDRDGRQIGWEFEFQVYEQLFEADDEE